ncbi:MAG: hypothetical protein WCG97_00940 [bacterium]
MQQGIKTLKISVLVIAIFCASFPIGAFAQKANGDSQESAYSNGVSKSSSSNGNYSSIATESLSCSAGQILSSLLSSAISSVLNKVTDTIGDTVSTISRKVSVDDDSTHNNQKNANNAQIGHFAFGSGIIDTPGWDAIAYCIVNSVISYIADSTIRWANSGFNGNPSFIENTGNFFQDLADREAGSFVSSLAKNITNGGVDLCSPFKLQISVGLSNYYSNGSNFKNSAKCSLTKVVGNIDKFTTGADFSSGGWNGWYSMTQNPQNNGVGAWIMSNDELHGRITAKNNTATLELGLNKGFLNYKKCSKPGDATSCKTVTPGIVIQGQLEKTLNLGKDRLVLAQKFDQVVEAIVNSLIKVALNEALGSGK